VTYTFALGADGAPVLLDSATVEAPPEPEVKPDRADGSVARRRDAVVDAARTMDDLSPKAVEAFARKRWRGDRPITEEDISSFAADARAHRADDVVDALDFRIRRAIYGRVGTKQMHVSIPRGITRKSLASLDGEEMGRVFQRLRDRGWSNAQIARHGVRRFDKDGSLRGLLK
jgi:hypothetical protein